MLDAIAVIIDSLPPNTTPSEIEIKYAFKCADGNGGWAGLSRIKGTPEKWRRALKSSTTHIRSEACLYLIQGYAGRALKD